MWPVALNLACTRCSLTSHHDSVRVRSYTAFFFDDTRLAFDFVVDVDFWLVVVLLLVFCFTLFDAKWIPILIMDTRKRCDKFT